VVDDLSTDLSELVLEPSLNCYYTKKRVAKFRTVTLTARPALCPAESRPRDSATFRAFWDNHPSPRASSALYAARNTSLKEKNYMRWQDANSWQCMIYTKSFYNSCNATLVTTSVPGCASVKIAA